MNKDIFIQTPFLRIGARAWGENTNPPILGLHGWMDNAATFDPIAPFFEKFYFLSMDLPGHGKSEKRSLNSGYAFVNWPIDVISAVYALGWKKFSLLGHSMGASISCFIAALYPEMVERLILVEGLGPMSDDSHDPIITLRKHIKETIFSVKKTPSIYPDLEDLILKRQKIGGITYKAAKLLIERSTEKTEEGYSILTDPRLRTTSPTRLTEEQVLTVLRQIECPVLLFKAKSGIPYDIEKITARCEAIKNLKIVEIEGSHHAHMEHPRILAEEIHHFFTE